MVITDGSTDGTDLIVATDKRAKLLHNKDRKGKAGAINAALETIKTTGCSMYRCQYYAE